MKRFIFLLFVWIHCIQATMWTPPEDKYKPIWIPPDEGTPTQRVLTKKEDKLLKKFNKRFLEYTLFFDPYGVLKEITALADIAFSKNPIFTGTYTQEHLFAEFEDLFGIGTECLYPVGARSPECSFGTSCLELLVDWAACPHHKYFYRGLPVSGGNKNWINITHIPDASGTLGDLTGHKGTWSLTVSYPHQIRNLDITPNITGTQAFEVAIENLANHFKKFYPNYPSLATIYERHKECAKDDFEYLKKQGGLKESSKTYVITAYGLAELCILIHQNLKPYLAWKVNPRFWQIYIDTKKSKVLYGYCNAKF